MLKTKEQIIDWLNHHKIENYVINQDLTVDVNGKVNLSHKNLKDFPIQFGLVKNEFDCSYNKLTSLFGAPHTVKSHFKCNNNKLKTLEFGPKIVSGYYECSENQLTSITHTPDTVHDFYCGTNKLTKLTHFPNVKGIADFSFNKISELNLSLIKVERVLTLVGIPLTTLSYQDIEKLDSPMIILPKLFSLLPIDKLVSQEKGKENALFRAEELKNYLLIQGEKINLEKLLSETKQPNIKVKQKL
jgi:hypothetical protein